MRTDTLTELPHCPPATSLSASMYHHFILMTTLWGCCSVAKLCPTLCDPMNCCTPGLPIPHHLHVHWMVMPSNHLILCHPFFYCHRSFPASGSFPMSRLFTSGGQSIWASASASVLLMNIQGLFPLWLTGLISLQFKGLSRVFCCCC